jgi:Tfp pilus assembly protein PilF
MPGYELWASREMASLGRSLGNTEAGASCWRMASDAAALAETRSEERFSAAYQSSVLAVAAGNLKRAELKARETIRLAPNWYKGHLLLSQILQIAGQNQDAAREAQISTVLGWRR